jgi:hypothetical protein
MTISLQYLRWFHDAEFGTFSADREAETVTLLLHRVNDTRAGFSFEGVRTLRASEFLHQNVVSRILLSSVNPERFDLGDIVKWVHTVGDKVCLTETLFDEIMQRLAAAELHLFYVDPSVGAEIAVLARAIRSTPPIVPTEAERSEA